MTIRHFAFCTLIGLLALSAAAPVVAGPPMSAHVRFGQENVADGIPPVGHPGSPAHHAVDSVVPRTVVISAGGTVTFEIASVHQIAVYGDGTRVEDIDVSAVTPGGSGCPPIPLIDDPDGRIAVLGDQPCAGGPAEPSYTFTSPGRYLVICTFLPHFTENEMYAWVMVK